MVLITLGIFSLFIAYAFKSESKFLRFSKMGLGIGVFFILIGLLSQLIVQIDAGNIGVKKVFGKVENDILNSGLHMVNPLADVIKLNVKTRNYTMSGIHDEGDKVGDDAIKVLSADGLEVTLDVTVLYRIEAKNAPTLLKEVGVDYENVLVRPIVRTRLRDNAVYYDAISLYSKKREEFQSKITNGIKVEFLKRGLILEDVLIRNIVLPASVKATIETKINAEQEAQKMQFVLQKEQQEAERKRVEAQGIADYQKIVAIGLTDKQLQYESIKAQKELAQSANAKIIFMNGSKSPVILSDK